MHMPTIFLLT